MNILTLVLFNNFLFHHICGSKTLSSRWINIMDIMNIMIVMDEYINLSSVSQLPLSSYGSITLSSEWMNIELQDESSSPLNV